jgi:quinol monooxygenase YgiN
MKYLLQGTLVAKPGEREALLQIMKRASTLMLEKAKGCELYAVGTHEGDENTVYITEIWATKEDHEASLTVEGVRGLIGEAIPILAEMPTKGREISVVNL